MSEGRDYIILHKTATISLCYECGHPIGEHESEDLTDHMVRYSCLRPSL